MPPEPHVGTSCPVSPVSSVHSHELVMRAEERSPDTYGRSRTTDEHGAAPDLPLKLSPEVQETNRQGNDQTWTVWSLISDWFIWEVLAVLLSAVTLAAIVAILAKFDHKPQPVWKHVSLNSVVSWLSTISKGCVLFAISEALGQLKWVWFAKKSRPMLNLRAFDSASRGFYGSGELMWALRFRALLANSTYYNTTGPPLQNGALFWVDPSLKANVYNSLFNNDRSRPWATPQYVCSTSNCTWDPIATLEVRARCSNVTDRLDISCSAVTGDDLGYNGLTNCTASLPVSNTTAWFLSGMAVKRPLSIATVQARSALVYKNASLPPIQMVVPDGLGMDGTTLRDNNTRWQATECSIQPMVHSFRAIVKNNVYKEDSIATWETSWATWDENLPLSTEELQKLTPGMYFQPPWGPDQGVHPNTTFGFSAQAGLSLQTFFQDLFTGYSFMRSIYSASFIPNSNTLYAGADFIQAMALGNITDCNATTADKLRCAMDNVAAAMSKSFRDSRFIAANSDPGTAQMAGGRAISSVTYVEVRWPWIVLPVLVWVLGAATLVGAMWKSRRAGVPKWKNDPIPLLSLYQGDPGKAVQAVGAGSGGGVARDDRLEPKSMYNTESYG
ncbi:DUF3176 domain-containing protein [Aspergillus alliaceus]|uniref:DUF3176 domain-containing protein n=1 Tax=Petromyces alliaceus TaxID=209559 RepID=UPI0012A41503|nr:uncharacterized protein BDW43DRAFT_303762 [Aspergillus alliaceus]KAB8228681.1 hypothetical protein BDW43DRAFT_303762 [Aspergillus alliaceus]